MNRTKSMILALVVLLSPMAANADPIPFDFQGTCLVDCARLGLADGDSFNEIGALVFADGTSTSAGSNYSLSDILSFDLFGIDFLTGNILSISTVGFVANDVLGGFILSSGGTNQFCYNFAGSTCAGGDFDSILPGSGVAAGSSGHGPAMFVRSAAVPEPGTLALFGIGLLGMGIARRKKKA